MSKREAYLEMYAHKIATYIFVEGTRNTSYSSWNVYFDEIEHHYGIDLTKDKELVEKIEYVLNSDFGHMIVEVEVEEDCFSFSIFYNYCMNIIDDELEERGLEEEDL